MIAPSEADATLRRIPLYVYDSTGSTPQTGLTFSGSEIQLSKNGAAFANFAGSVTEIGSGAYYYTATLGEVDTSGFLALKLVKTGCQTILQTTTIMDLDYTTSSFRIPLYATDDFGVPQTGLTISTSELQISENGGAFANRIGAVTEVGSGLYYYTPDASEKTASGFLLAKLVKTGVRTTIVAQDLDEGQTGTGGSGLAVTSIVYPTVETDPLTLTITPGAEITHVAIAFRDHEGAPIYLAYRSDINFVHPFDLGSTVSGPGPFVYTIYRRGRWPTGTTITTYVTVTDAAGSAVTEVL